MGEKCSKLPTQNPGKITSCLYIFSYIPGNNGENNAANYLHKILVNSPSVCILSVTSVIAPVSASSIPCIHPSDDEHQNSLGEFPSINYGEKNPSEIMVKIPD